jgi:hypothetical protein
MPKTDHYIRVILAILVICFKEQSFINGLAKGMSMAGGGTHWAAVDCACPEDQLVYECSVQGGVATVWRGSAFDCGQASNDIILRHSRSNSVGVCNNGRLVAQIVEAFNGTFTSQLNITVIEDMNNKTIKCAVEYVNGTMSVIKMNIIIAALGTLIIIL